LEGVLLLCRQQVVVQFLLLLLLLLLLVVLLLVAEVELQALRVLPLPKHAAACLVHYL
jgi:hypothetical protein